MRRIAVVGGGIAGVAAAYELARLARSGIAVEATLFEGSQRLGGIVETHREGGFTIECGPDGWVTEKPWARELAVELGLADELMFSNDASRKTYVLLAGRLEPMPEGMRMMVPGDMAALAASSLLSAEAKQAYAEEVGRAEELRRGAPREDESVASFVRRHFGEEVLEKLAAPLLSGVFGGDVERLSVRAVMAPFVAMEREQGSLIAALQSRTGKGGGASVFTTLRSGLGTLIDRMVATLPAGGVRLNAPVDAMERIDGEWRLRVKGEARGFDAVLLAVPVDAARELVTPMDAEAGELMRMESSSAVVVAFAFSSEARMSLPGGFGFLAPEGSGSLLLASTFVDQKFAHRTPQGGRLVRAFFGGGAAEKLGRCNNDEVAAIARMELARILGPLPDAQVTVVRRWPKSLPQYEVGHLERMAALDGQVERLGGLYLLGNGYRGVGLPDLVRDACGAAQRAVLGTA